MAADDIRSAIKEIEEIVKAFSFNSKQIETMCGVMLKHKEKIDKIELPSNLEKEIIIIDNNSTDGTKEFLKSLLNHNKYKIIFKDKNYGKGNSIITGIKEASGNLIVFQDADLEYDPNNYAKLVNYLNKNKLDAVFGSRIMHDEDYFYYKLNRFSVVNQLG